MRNRPMPTVTFRRGNEQRSASGATEAMFTIFKWLVELGFPPEQVCRDIAAPRLYLYVDGIVTSRADFVSRRIHKPSHQRQTTISEPHINRFFCDSPARFVPYRGRTYIFSCNWNWGRKRELNRTPMTWVDLLPRVNEEGLPSCRGCDISCSSVTLDLVNGREEDVRFYLATDLSRFPERLRFAKAEKRIAKGLKIDLWCKDAQDVDVVIELKTRSNPTSLDKIARKLSAYVAKLTQLEGKKVRGILVHCNPKFKATRIREVNPTLEVYCFDASDHPIVSLGEILPDHIRVRPF
jgi:hypothetical protein